MLIFVFILGVLAGSLVASLVTVWAILRGGEGGGQRRSEGIEEGWESKPFRFTAIDECDEIDECVFERLRERAIRREMDLCAELFAAESPFPTSEMGRGNDFTASGARIGFVNEWLYGIKMPARPVGGCFCPRVVRADEPAEFDPADPALQWDRCQVERG